MLGFPKQLPGTAEIRFEEEQERADELKDDDSSGNDFKSFYEAEKFFWTDPVIVAQFFCEVFESLIAAGLFAFGLKFMEQMFYLTPSQAGVITGILTDLFRFIIFLIFCEGISAAIAAVIGIVGNGAIIRVFNMNVRQCCYLYLFQSICGCLVIIPYFFVPCPNRPLNGLIDANRELIDPPNLINDYNANCNCLEEIFSPYCIDDGNTMETYFSVSPF